jgi:hypothetical protein
MLILNYPQPQEGIEKEYPDLRDFDVGNGKFALRRHSLVTISHCVIVSVVVVVIRGRMDRTEVALSWTVTAAGDLQRLEVM